MTPPNPAFDEHGLSRIEDAGLNASAPPQQRWLDGWLVRFSPGKAKRARCVNAVADGRLPLDERLAACERLYAQAALPMIVRITPFSAPAGLDAVLEARGLRRFDDTRVMVLGALAATVRAAAEAALPSGHTMHPLQAEAFAERVGSFRGSPAEQRLAHAVRIAQSPVPHHGFELRREGVAVACGQFALEDGAVGLYDVFTAPPARGAGLARLLCTHLLAEAAARGARQAYLQVEADNLPARAVYHRLGFIDGYAYHYRTRDPAAA
jgi:ribosomal protein S18 acetylase RimI-like enzyme